MGAHDSIRYDSIYDHMDPCYIPLNNCLTCADPAPIVHLMVNNSELQLDRLFQALSDNTRRTMLSRLSRQEMSVAELAEPFALSKSAISKHLKVLEDAGLLRRTIEGRVHRCRINAKPLSDVSEWVNFYEPFWNRKLDTLDAFLNDEN